MRLSRDRQLPAKSLIGKHALDLRREIRRIIYPCKQTGGFRTNDFGDAARSSTDNRRPREKRLDEH